MVTFDMPAARGTARLPTGWRWLGRWLRRQLPTGLYARSLLIIIIPMVLLQSVVAGRFHGAALADGHASGSRWRVTRDIAAIIEIIETYPQDTDYSEATRIARDQLDLQISIEQDGELPPPRAKPLLLDSRMAYLSDEITDQIKRPFWIDTVGDSNSSRSASSWTDKILRVLARRSQTYASNTHIFIVWMVGSVAGADHHLHPVPARPDPPDPVAGCTPPRASARARRPTTFRAAQTKSAAPASPSSSCASASSARWNSAPPC